MNEVSRPFRWFSIWSVSVTFWLIVVGGVVRVTGSGDACPDWPLCYGSIIPPFEARIWIEWTHRLSNTLVAPSILGMALWTTLRYRRNALLVRSAWLALVLLVVQIVLGGLVVIFGLPGALVGIHLANALLIWSALLLISLCAHRPWANVTPRHDPRLRRLIVLSALGVYALIFSGTVVTGTQYNTACLGWPLCNDSLLAQTLPQTINIFHRYFAAAVGLLLIATLAQTLRASRNLPPLRAAVLLAIGLFLAQIIVGALNVLTLFQPFWNALHLVTAAAVWGGMFALVVVARQCLSDRAAPAPATQTGAQVGQSFPSTASGQ